MATKLGIPYMGGKRKIADKLLHAMLVNSGGASHFYDLFGGGGAMSAAAMQSCKFDSVHYNELNTAVVSLFDKIRTDGVTPEFYQWISRERFFELIKGDDWLAGLAQTCWSFGNGQKSYLYSKEITPIKKQLHDAVMFAGGIHKRLDVLREYRKVCMESGDCKDKLVQHLERLQHLESLESLESFMPQHGSYLSLSNLSYEDVPITTPVDSTIIYCDIPYIGTHKYKEDAFNHAAFFEWCIDSKYTIYVSSYEAPLHCIYETPHRSTLSATNNSKMVVERLFCNKDMNGRGVLF